MVTFIIDKSLFIPGRIPSKKNSRITTRTGRSFPSKNYTAWHEKASWDIKFAKNKFGGKIDSDTLVLKFYMPDNRRCDLTNKAESIMDLLVDNGIIKDDSWQVIKSLTLEFVEVNKEMPGCLVVW